MTDWLGLVALAATLLLVGESLLRPLAAPRLRRRLPAFERVAVSASLGFCVLTWWGIALAEAGVFSVPMLLGPPAACSAVGLALSAWRSPTQRPTQRQAQGRPRRRGWDLFGWGVAAALCAVGTFLYFPPFDVRLEARDPGTYYLTGVQIAKEGAIAIIDPTVQQVPMEDRPFWFTAIRTYTEVEALRFMGFTLQDRNTGRVIPQALPALPVWIGFGYATGGPPWALRATGVLAIVALLQMFVLTRRWVDPFAGAVAAGLLCISFPQMWFAKFAAAEVLGQGLLAIGAYGWLMFRRRHGGAFGLLGAMGFGLAWMTKAELLLIGGPLAMIFFVDLARRRLDRRALLCLWGPLVALAVHTALHARFWSWPYYSDLLMQGRVNVRDPGQMLTLALAGVVVVATPAMLLVVVRRTPARARASLTRLGKRWLPIAAGLGAAAGLAWGYWRWPLAYAAILERAGRYVPIPDYFNVIELGWALGNLTLVLAPLGAALLLRSGLRRPGSPAWLFGAFVPVSIYRRQIWQWIPWAYRRWLPFVLPAMAIAMAAALSAVVAAARRRLRAGTTRDRLLAATALLLVAIVLAVTASAAWQQTARYREHQELPGTLDLIIELLDAIPPDHLVLFETRTDRGLVRWEAVLDIERDRRVLRLQQAGVPAEYVRRLMRLEQRAGRPTYLLTTGLIDSEARLGGRPVKEIEFNTHRLAEVGSDRLFFEGRPLEPPTLTEPQRFRFRIYELDLVNPAAPLDGELDVGEWDDLYLVGNTLHEAERDAEGRTYRWTNGRSGFYLPGMDSNAREVVIEADPDTPAGVAPQTLQVLVDGVDLGTVEVTEGWNKYGFALPAGWRPGARAPLVQVVGPTFRPRDFDASSSDDRPLAIKVSRVFWQ